MRSIIVLTLVLIVGAAVVMGALVLAGSTEGSVALEWWYRFTAIVAVIGLGSAVITQLVKRS